MMKSTLCLASALLFSCAAVAGSDPAEGRWVTISDEDGSQDSIIEIAVNADGKLQGTIVELLKEADKGEVCEDCPDAFHNQPIEGLTFMWDLEREGRGEWNDGNILDPRSGSVYTSKLTVADDGQSLEVRGYIGVSWLGRSQTWLKAQQPTLSEAQQLAGPETQSQSEKEIAAE